MSNYKHTKRLALRLTNDGDRVVLDIGLPSHLNGLYRLPAGVTVADLQAGDLKSEHLPGKLRMYFTEIRKGLKA